MIRKKHIKQEIDETKDKLREIELDIRAAIIHVRNLPDVDRMSNKEMLDALFNEFTRVK
jgi:uncharacterized protein (UPF0210 family)